MTLDLHAEALGAADVDVVLGQIHAVASHVRAERFNGGEDRGHARLVLDLLKQLLADQKGLDALLDDLRHRPRDHESRVLDVQRVLDGDGVSVWALVRTGHRCIVGGVSSTNVLTLLRRRVESSMSMVLINPSAPDRIFYTHLFARFVRERRRELRLTVSRAAELTGMTVSQWLALEAGWVPQDTHEIRTISETLEVRTSDLGLMSIMSACAQEGSVQ